MPATTAAPAGTFEGDTRIAMRRLIDAVGDLLEASAGLDASGPEVAKVLGIDRKLAWKLVRIATARDVFEGVAHVPGPAGMDIVVKAAERVTRDAELAAAIRGAHAGFEALIPTHAGDRASLEMMARGCVAVPNEQAELNHRREAFLGQSFTWGVQARTQLSINLFWPSKTPGHLDVRLVSGLVDLRRLRPHVGWTVARLGFVGSGDDPAKPGEPPKKRGMPPPPLLEDFSSVGPDAFTTAVDGDGVMEIGVDDGPVGDTGAMTCIFAGPIIRAAAPVTASADDPDADLNVHVRTPVRTLLHDLVVQRELFGPLEPTALVHSEVQHILRTSRRPHLRTRLPIRLGVESAGPAPEGARTRDVPRSVELVERLLAETGFPAEAFDVYRIRMEFPIVPTAVTMRFPLPTDR